ncbi:MAG TPA: glutamate--tRNA ligase, partial [Acidimicrobiia bacterium]
YDADSWAKVMLRDEVGAVLEAGRAAIAGAEPWDVVTIENALRALPEELGIGAGKVFQPLRVAVTGSSVSPPLFESITALGRDRTLERIDRALRELG